MNTSRRTAPNAASTVGGQETRAGLGGLVSGPDSLEQEPNALEEHDLPPPRIPPAVTPVVPDNIPRELRTLKQWVLWRYVWKGAKWTKVPSCVATKSSSGWNSPAQWATFDEAWRAYQDPGWDGIGLVLNEADTLVGVDLDNCRDPVSGELLPWTADQRTISKWASDAPDAAELVRQLQSYAEVTPSQRGVRIFARGMLPRNGKQGPFEVYNCRRFLTVTGQVLPDAPLYVREVGNQLISLSSAFLTKAIPSVPTAVAPRGPTTTGDDREILEKARSAANGSKFDRLWQGVCEEYPSASEAELALCSMLAFWTGPDPVAIDRLFRQSQLMRDKWDEPRPDHGTYGRQTITKALETKHEFFDWNNCGQGAAVAARIHLGDLELRPGLARRTASKLILPVEIWRSGVQIDLQTLSDATSARKSFVRELLKHMGENSGSLRSEVDAAVAALLVQGSVRTSPRAGGDHLPSMNDLVSSEARRVANFAYVTSAGKAFDRMTNRLYSRSQFVERLTNNELLEKLGLASDAPRLHDNSVSRPALMTSLERELRLVWGDLIRNLPDIQDADLGPTSDAAGEFRSLLWRVWAGLHSWSINRHAIDGGGSKEETMQLAHRESLVQCVRISMAAAQASSAQRDGWQQVKAGLSAWHRCDRDSLGRPRRWLAMRYELLHQLNARLPEGVTDQRSWKLMGVKYGLFVDEPEVPDRMTGGGRLVVLADPFTEELLSISSDEEGE